MPRTMTDSGRGGDHLVPLLEPASIAVIGASTDRAKVGGRLVHILQKRIFAGRLYPVNPKLCEVHGTRCFASVADLPEPVDLAIVCLPASAVPDAMRECIAAEVRAVCVVSSGFREAGPEGAELEDEIAGLARAHGLTLLGPNTVGLANFTSNIPASFATALIDDGPEPGPVSLVMQSGALGSYAIARARQLAVGLDCWVSTGNAAQLDVADVALGIVERKSTGALGVYIEGTRSGESICALARRALEKNKPLLLLKGATTESGREAARTHTGTLAGDRRIWDGVAAAHGMIRADAFDDFFETLAVAGCFRVPAGARLAMVSSSGATGVLAIDAAETLGCDFAHFSPQTVEELGKLGCGRGNPVDVAGRYAEAGFTRELLELLGRDPEADVVVMMTGARERQHERLLAEIKAAKDAVSKPVVAVWTAGSDDLIRSFWEASIPCFQEAVPALRALARLSRYANQRDNLLAAEKQRVTAAPGTVLELPKGMVSESAGKRLLREYGVTVPGGRLAGSREEAASLIETVGPPVAMKVESPNIVHKTEAGGVVLGIADPGAAADAFDRIVNAAEAAGAKVNGVYIENMAPPGVELLVGITRDPQFGLCLVVGLGGIWTEIIDDVRCCPLPVGIADVERLLSSLRGRAILEGARGTAIDRAAVAATIVNIARIAGDLGDRLIAMEVNPLRATTTDVIALDCRIEISGGT